MITVRDAEDPDIEAVRQVLRAAFGRSAEADIVDKLRAGGDAVFSIVAVERTAVIGHLMLSRMTAPFPALALAPVAVSPDRQKQGIGSRMIRVGIERARAEGWQAIFVLGDPRYYRRFGFDAALASGFTSQYAGHNLMALALGAALPTHHGVIEHATPLRS